MDQEVIVLKAVWDLIDEMVNYEMFVKSDGIANVTLLPSTSTHQQLFNIIVLDFLSTPDAASFDLPAPPNGSPQSDKSYLFYLRRIYQNPKLNPKGAHEISIPVEMFVQWLEAECLIEKVWFPSINVETDLKLQRISFIKICGNISKHSFAGMSRDSKLIATIFRENGVELDDDQRFLVIPEFYEWFHRDILSYHLSAIAEFLNNIRWGIYLYLKPEWTQSYTRDARVPAKYGYIIPTDCKRPLAQSMYWDLMNDVREKPYMPRFEVTPFLKMRY